MTIKVFISVLSFLVIVSGSSWVYAVNAVGASLEKNSENQDSQFMQLKTLFLSKETREKIDQQRESYLNPMVEKKAIKLLPKVKGGG